MNNQKKLINFKRNVFGGILFAALAVFVANNVEILKGNAVSNQKIESVNNSISVSIENNPLQNETLVGTEIGIQKFPVGTLLKNEQGEVYIVRNNGVSYVPSFEHLTPYAGQPIIAVGNDVVNYYKNLPQDKSIISAEKTFNSKTTGILVRTPDENVFAVDNNGVRLVATLSFKTTFYLGMKIQDISFAELDQYRSLNESKISYK